MAAPLNVLRVERLYLYLRFYGEFSFQKDLPIVYQRWQSRQGAKPTNGKIAIWA